MNKQDRERVEKIRVYIKGITSCSFDNSVDGTFDLWIERGAVLLSIIDKQDKVIKVVEEVKNDIEWDDHKVYNGTPLIMDKLTNALEELNHEPKPKCQCPSCQCGRATSGEG